jgi:hypothetical protein
MLNGTNFHLLKGQIRKEFKRLSNSQKDLNLFLLFQKRKVNSIFLKFLISQVLLSLLLLLFLIYH